MALTSAGLVNGGTTAHYQFQYDDSLSAPRNPGGPEPARTNAVIAACEGDFNLMSGWFGNIDLDVNFTIPVNVTQNGGGASWATIGRSLTVTINPANGNATLIRYLVVSEMVEQFMRAQGKGWFGTGTEGSEGEGLSRFLAAQFLALNGLGNTPAGFSNSNTWLGTSRADFVNNISPADDGPDAVTGCSLLFIIYLFSQLGFGVNAIVAAGAPTLAGVYRNLTGDPTNPFLLFKHQLDIVYPGTSIITGPNSDNPYPIGKTVVWHNSSSSETQLWFMNGGQIARRATVVDEEGAATFVGPPWRIVGTSDMNIAGGSAIVWHNSSTNETQIWFMDSERIARRATVVDENGAAALVGHPWRIVGIGSMNAAGSAKIVWHNSSSNETQIWFMSGERIARRATVVDENGAAALVGPPWRTVGTSDLNSAGSAEIVWHNSSTNETQFWFMSGERIARRATVLDENGAAAFVGPPWRIVGTGEMNVAANLDILWHNSSTNDIQFWFMDGPQIRGRNGVVDETGNIIRIGAPWGIAGPTGYAGESAIVWYDSSTGDIQFWFMDGPQIKGRNAVIDETGNVIRIGAPWSIAGVTGYAGETAILWHNSSTNDIQFWFMDGPRIRGRNGVVDETGNIIRIGAPWSIAGLTGCAGETAILWHNGSTNDIQFWFMDGPRIRGRNGVVDETGNIIRIGVPWTIAGSGEN